MQCAWWWDSHWQTPSHATGDWRLSHGHLTRMLSVCALLSPAAYNCRRPIMSQPSRQTPPTRAAKQPHAKAPTTQPAAARQRHAASDEEEDSEEGSEDSEASDDLLPRDVSPLHYALRLVPDYSSWSFSARLVVQLRITGHTDQIQFNAADLCIDSAVLLTSIGSSEGSPQQPQQQQSQSHSPMRMLHDEEEEVSTLRFDAPLPLGDASLSLLYSGRIRDDLIGLYRSHYSFEGRAHTILATQFEACDARRVLPCWDEPARKATFSLALTLVLPPHLSSTSNMPLHSSRALTSPEELTAREETTGWIEHCYETTPIMSSYLLGFAIGEFESVQAHAVSSNPKSAAVGGTTTSTGTSTGTGTLVRCLTPLGARWINPVSPWMWPCVVSNSMRNISRSPTRCRNLTSWLCQTMGPRAWRIGDSSLSLRRHCLYTPHKDRYRPNSMWPSLSRMRSLIRSVSPVPQLQRSRKSQRTDGEIISPMKNECVCSRSIFLCFFCGIDELFFAFFLCVWSLLLGLALMPSGSVIGRRWLGGMICG